MLESLQRQCVNDSHGQPDCWPWMGQQPMDSLPGFSIGLSHDFNLLANHMFQCSEKCVLNGYRQVTVTDRVTAPFRVVVTM